MNKDEARQRPSTPHLWAWVRSRARQRDQPMAHPNATKVFVNCLLSREGQSQLQNHFMRIDPIFG
jgi:hypothetical protein